MFKNRGPWAWIVPWHSLIHPWEGSTEMHQILKDVSKYWRDHFEDDSIALYTKSSNWSISEDNIWKNVQKFKTWGTCKQHSERSGKQNRQSTCPLPISMIIFEGTSWVKFMIHIPILAPYACSLFWFRFLNAITSSLFPFWTNSNDSNRIWKPMFVKEMG